MSWKYKKTRYENLYQWMESDEGTCFYCKKDRDEEDMGFKFFVEGHKGICKICLADFEIGHLGTDRHVVQRLIPNYTRKVDVLNWFRKKGCELIETDSGDDWTAYAFINDPETYEKSNNELQEKGYFVGLDNGTTRIEIFKDGNIHIVY